MKAPRSLHVVSGLKLGSGGPSQSVTQLCEALIALGAPAEIATVQAPDEEMARPPTTPIHAFPPRLPRRLRHSPGLAAFLMKESSRFDLIHVHGLWEWPGIYARRAAVRHGLPLLISPRGMLEPWSLQQSRAFKHLAMALWEGRNLSTAALLHATSEAEATQFRNLGLNNPLAVVPNGLDFPAVHPVPKASPRKVLFLSRFHPKKGADLLLQAWAALPDRGGWALDLAGPDEQGHRATLEALAKALGLQDSVTFLGPQYGEAKWALIRQSSLMVLSSHSENFGNVVAEALSQGVPVIATHGTPWSGLVTNGCGWWSPATVDGLKEALASAIAMEPEALSRMGQRGSAWVRSAFTAEATAREMLRHYQETLALFSARR